MCIAFNVAQIAKTTGGRRWIGPGIRRLRRELTRQIGLAPVIVFAQDCYGIFDIEEIVTARGVPPDDDCFPIEPAKPARYNVCVKSRATDKGKPGESRGRKATGLRLVAR